MAMLQRFGSTKDPWVAGRVLYACVPGANAVADADRLPTWNAGDEFLPARELSGVK